MLFRVNLSLVLSHHPFTGWGECIRDEEEGKRETEEGERWRKGMGGREGGGEGGREEGREGGRETGLILFPSIPILALPLDLMAVTLKVLNMLFKDRSPTWGGIWTPKISS